MIYVVYYIHHYDDYKRADSSANVLKVYQNEDNAYEYCVKEQLKNLCEDHGMKRIHWKYMENDDISYIDKYEYFRENFEDIFGEGEFTMSPSHTLYCVKKFEEFSNFSEDIDKVKYEKYIDDNDEDVSEEYEDDSDDGTTLEERVNAREAREKEAWEKLAALGISRNGDIK